MEVSVWDTYVQRADGKLMHFDILVPSSLKDETAVLSYGNTYLSEKPFVTDNITTKECRFCHNEVTNSDITQQIVVSGFYIIEMENCD